MADFPERIRALEPFWGSWKLDATLGEGSYGKVYRIRREEFGNVFYSALKWIPLPQSQGETRALLNEGMTEPSIREYYGSLVRSLQTEITLMNKLRGTSHVVSFEDHAFIERTEEIGWDVLIRMELLIPLPDRVRAGMTVRDVIRMGLDLCDALSLCGRNHIVHRDIKPDNIFYSENGDYKLGDFGVARQMERTVTHMSVKGTPFYMAPEVYGNRQSDATVDQYSLGLVMHRLLNAQQVPFAPLTDRILTHPEREEAFLARLRGTPVQPPLQGSVRLKQAICKACQFRPKKRFAGPEAFREALEAALQDKENGEPLIVGTYSPLRSGRSSIGSESGTVNVSSRRIRRRTILLAASVLLAACLGLAVWLAAHARDTRQTADGGAGPTAATGIPEKGPEMAWTATLAPTEKPTDAATPVLTATPAWTATPAPTEKLTDTATPDPTATPAWTATPAPTDKPADTATPALTATPAWTATPAPTDKPADTATPLVSETPTPAPVELRCPIITSFVQDTTEPQCLILRWEPQPQADGYRIHVRYGQENQPSIEVRDGAADSWRLEGIPDGTTVSVYIASTRGAEISTDSETESCVVLQTPAFVELYSADHGSNTLRWSASEGAQSYVVYRAIGSRERYAPTNPTLECQYTDQAAEEGVRYFYCVCAGAYNSLGEYSVSARTEPLEMFELAAPTVRASSQAAQGGTSQLAVGWNEIKGATAYWLVWDVTDPETNAKTTDGAMITPGENGVLPLQYTIADLTVGSSVGVTVTGYNTQEAETVAGASSNLLQVRILAMPTITSIAVKQNSDRTVQWSAVPNATEYYLYRYKDNGNAIEKVISVGNVTRYQDQDRVELDCAGYAVCAGAGADSIGPASKITAVR